MKITISDIGTGVSLWLPVRRPHPAGIAVRRYWLDEGMPAYDAFLLVSFGGPEGPDDVMPFLENVTRGRGVPPERLAGVAEHYYAVGGVSPINQQCRDMLAAIRAAFPASGLSLPAYWGNRNWTPYLADTVQAMADDGVRRAVALVTSAYSSYSGCRQYLDDIERARAAVGPGAPRIDKIRRFFNHPGFIEPFAASTRAALATLPPDLRDDAHLVFTAHSIPVAMAQASGPGVRGAGPGGTGGGSPPCAEKVGEEEWVIDGQKIWMTFGASADWLYVLCRTEPGSSRHHGLSLLIVPARQPGVQIRPITNMLGHGEFCEVFFDSARTSADLVVGAPGDGWKVAMAALGVERGTLLMPQQLGFEREAEHVLDLARDRAAAGASAGGLSHRLVDAWIAVRLMRVTALRTIGELVAGRTPGAQAATAKLYASVQHQRLLELATELLAEDATVTGDGYALEPLARAFLLSRAETIYGGSSQIQRNIIGERILGLPREPRPSLRRVAAA